MTSSLQMDVQTAMAETRTLPTMPKTADLNKMREKAQDFEAVFLSQMLKPVFESIDTDGPFGGGQAESMWRSLMVDEYGKSMAKSGGIGLAGAVMSEMLRLQEAH